MNTNNSPEARHLRTMVGLPLVTILVIKYSVRYSVEYSDDYSDDS